MDNVYSGLVLVVFLLTASALPQTDREFRTFRGPCAFDTEHSAACPLRDTVLLGGVFPLHSWKADKRYPLGGYCNGAIRKEGFQRMEAMRFAIDQVNAAEIIPGVQLAFEMRDSCLSPDLTRQHAIRFINRGIGSGDHCNTTFTGTIPVSGIVGAASSSSSIAAADLLGLFKVPQISYASTSATLSNKDRYRYFLRTVPPDNFQAQVMMALIDALEANYFSLIHSKGNYGEDGAKEIRAAAAAAAEKNKKKGGSGVCIAVDETVGKNTAGKDPSVYKEVMSTLLGKVGRNASVVVAFTGITSSRELLEEAARAGFSQNLPEHYIWIASDAWANSAQVASSIALNTARGSLGVEPQSSTVDGFKDHIRALHPDSNTALSFNPWLNEFWQSVFSCNPDSTDDRDRTACRQKHLSNSSYFEPFQQEAYVPFVIDAVYTFAHAIRQLQRRKCRGRFHGICPAMLSSETARLGAIDGAALLPHLLNLEFNSSAGHKVAFTPNGDLATAGYDITNLQADRAAGEGSYKPVGSWHRLTHAKNVGPSRRVVSGVLHLVHCLTRDETPQFNHCTPAELRLNLSAIQWRNGSFGAEKMPRSRCSVPCQAGHYTHSLGDPFPPKLSSCCWKCKQCNPNFVTSTQFQRCQRCPARQRANSNQTSCVGLSPVYWSLRNGQAVGSVLLSIIGVCLTVIIAVVGLCLNNRLPMYSALHIETLLHCLVGALGLFTSVFIMINKPTSTVCLLRDVWVSLSMTLLITPFLIQLGFLIWQDHQKAGLAVIFSREEDPSEDSCEGSKHHMHSYQRENTPIFEFLERRKATITLAIILTVNAVISTATAVSANLKIDEEVNANTRLAICCPTGRTAIAGGLFVMSISIATIGVRFYIHYARRYIEVHPTLHRASFIMVIFLLINVTGLGVSTLLSPLPKMAMLSFSQLAIAFAFIIIVIIPDLRISNQSHPTAHLNLTAFKETGTTFQAPLLSASSDIEVAST